MGPNFFFSSKMVIQWFGMKPFRFNCGRQGQGQVLVVK